MKDKRADKLLGNMYGILGTNDCDRRAQSNISGPCLGCHRKKKKHSNQGMIITFKRHHHTPKNSQIAPYQNE